MEQTIGQPSLRRLDYHYIAMQMGFWAMFAAIVAYQTALLLDRGFTNGEAGLMTSVRCLAGIVCQPLLGGFADRHPEVPLKRIVTLSMLLSLAAGIWYWLDPGLGLGGTALVWAVLNFLYAALAFSQGHFTGDAWLMIAVCIPLSLMATFLGNRISKRISRDAFMKLTYVMLVAVGVLLVLT